MTVHLPILLSGLLLVILTLTLALMTSLERLRSNTMFYEAHLDPTSHMAKVQRAHGNASEYTALLIGLFLITSLAHQGRDLGLAVTGLVTAVTASRYLHALGFLICKTLERPHILKVIGSTTTYAGGLALAVIVLVRLV